MSNRQWNRGRAGTAIAALAWLLGAACAGEHSGPPGLIARLALAGGGPSTCSGYLADVENGFRLDADTSTPGSSPQIVFEMAIPGSATTILLTHDVVITLPAAFGFQGFGTPGASAGSWDFDFSNPGNGAFDPIVGLFDYRIPHRAVGPNDAYADTLANGVYDAGIDSTATHSIGGGGAHVFTLTLPSGGTNNNGAGGNCSYFDTDVRFTLPAGIVTLPAAPGSYDVTIVATSVDPDTGDGDDGQGVAPSIYQRTVPVSVPEPAASLGAGAVATALAALGRARRRSHRDGADAQPR